MFDCIIIGAGPGGLTSGIYLKRAGLNILLIEKNMPGGQMALSSLIENYPGFKEIDGISLSMNMYDQIQKLKIEFRSIEVIKIEKINDYFIINTLKEKFETKTIIVSTGMKYIKLGVLGEEKFTGKGISWCAICDGALYKKKDVAVIGGGNSALEESIYLSKMVNKVYLIHRRDSFRADNILLDKVKTIDNIELVLNDEVVEFIGNTHLEKIRLKSSKEINIDGAFEFIGFMPNSSLVNEFNITNEKGFIVVDKKYETSVKGLFAIGDVIEKEVRQIATAVGDGAQAAYFVNKLCK